MQYLVTGATGFIGRHLVPLLLARGGDVVAVVRPGSRHRFAALRESLGDPGERLRMVAGDLAEPLLGIDAGEREQLAGATIFHLAAVSAAPQLTRVSICARRSPFHA